MTPQMQRLAVPSRAEIWFKRLAWIGILFNLPFVLMQLTAPNFINMSIGLNPGFPTLWNRAHGVMVLSLSILYIPAAVNPLLNPAYTWLIVLARLIAAIFWAWCIATRQGALGAYFVMDAAFFFTQALLLQAALPSFHRFPAILSRLTTGVASQVRSAFRSTKLRASAAVLAVVVAALGWVIHQNLFRHTADVVASDQVQHFKYGTIGLGSNSRIPYWIFVVLPDVFKDKLPAGGDSYASLGFIMEPGADRPVGFTRRTFGYDVLEANCSLCHTAGYRTSPDAKPVVVPGAPAHTLDLQGFQRFLYDSASDPRFTPDIIMTAIAKVHQFSAVEAFFYRNLIIPATRVALLEQKAAYAWQSSRPQQGRGRTDTFNPTKLVVFHMPDDGTIGTTDLPAVWNQKPRENMWLHWDGNNDQIEQRNYAAAMAVGATAESVLPDSFKAVTDYLLTLQPPAFPFPIDHARTARGAKVYAANCAGCHAFGSSGIGQVEDISETGTDPHRLLSFTQSLVDRFHTFRKPPFDFTAYRKTNGYSRVPIDGIWLRGPYLHNGSVPNLRALLMREDERPKVFYRGYDVIDPVNVGFVSDGPAAAQVGFRVDISVPGNSNRGHRYGIDVDPDAKEDLLEYLKTL